MVVVMGGESSGSYSSGAGCDDSDEGGDRGMKVAGEWC